MSSFYVYFMKHLVWRVCFYWSVYDPQRDIFACIHLYICVFVITQKMFEMNLSNILNNGFLSIGSQFTTYNCTTVRNMLWNPFRTTIVSVDLTLLLYICMYAYSCIIYMSRRDHTSTTNDIQMKKTTVFGSIRIEYFWSICGSPHTNELTWRMKSYYAYSYAAFQADENSKVSTGRY